MFLLLLHKKYVVVIYYLTDYWGSSVCVLTKYNWWPVQTFCMHQTLQSQGEYSGAVYHITDCKKAHDLFRRGGLFHGLKLFAVPMKLFILTKVCLYATCNKVYEAKF